MLSLFRLILLSLNLQLLLAPQSHQLKHAGAALGSGQGPFVGWLSHCALVIFDNRFLVFKLQLDQFVRQKVKLQLIVGILSQRVELLLQQLATL